MVSPAEQPSGVPPLGGSDAANTAGIGSLLDAFGAMAEDMDLDTVLERVTTAACQLVDARFGALGVVGPDRKLSQFVVVGLDDDAARRIGSLPEGHGVLGLLITDPRPLRLHDLREHPRSVGFPAHHPRMTSFLGVPIRIHGKVFGNLYLTEKNGGEDFSATDEQLLVALAAAAGVAIENSRLFDDATRRTRWLEGGLNAARELLEQDDAARNDFGVLTRHALYASHSNVAVVLRDFGHDRGVICEAAEGEHADAFVGRSGAEASLLEDLSAASEPLLLTAADAARLLPGAPPGVIDTLMCTMLSGTEDRQFLLIGRSAAAPPFSAVDHEMMQSFTSHVSLALELLGAHRRREQQAVFGDRDRIARDLHDLVIQRLFAAGLSIQGLRKFLTDSEPLNRITAVTSELDSTIRELRDTIYSLRSVPQITPTFTSSIFALVAEVFDGHELEPVVQLSGPLDAVVEQALAAHVRAILIEGLSNALRHADASSVTVALQATRDRLELTITDDGRGFEQAPSTGGLANMRHRAELSGGVLNISSTPGQGTVVVLTVPLGL
ncbi:GAF domain-containing sensor histidine kinase [Arthrobacter echini]|uniref:GAF domain-containing sensor histidine kinase n=1 Tax=Arthrobacter echini TaxID=1529066 RepID=A0A4S5E794_9MICC|nr:GAF domain-containing sensor histidine kinase [Arthrobacter echini]THJ67467.1 GAF domain-containing sensor histidine kinase [Arthrobacter echini]